MFKLVFELNIGRAKEEWLFTKTFNIPFAPFRGLTIKSERGFVSTIGGHDDICWDGEKFIVQNRQARNPDPINGPELFIKMYESQGWLLVKKPAEVKQEVKISEIKGGKL